MLKAAGIPFGLAEGEAEEDALKQALRAGGAGARDLALGLAEVKALAASPEPRSLVVGADQTLETADGAMFDKPRSIEEARDQLRSLAGKAHRLHSAAAVAESGEIVWREAESVTLTMRAFSEDFLDAYLAREYEAIRWGVGGYRIEGPGVQLFERIEGSHFAILGLPLLPLLSYLRTRGALPS